MVNLTFHAGDIAANKVDLLPEYGSIKTPDSTTQSRVLARNTSRLNPVSKYRCGYRSHCDRHRAHACPNCERAYPVFAARPFVICCSMRKRRYTCLGSWHCRHKKASELRAILTSMRLTRPVCGCRGCATSVPFLIGFPCIQNVSGADCLGG